MGGPAGRGCVWLGSGPAAVSDPCPGRPVRDRVRSSRTTARRQADPDPHKGATGERACRTVDPIGEDRVSGSSGHRQRAPPAARPGRVRRLLQCVASPSGVEPTSAERIRSTGGVYPRRPDHRSAGARGPASCVSACSLRAGMELWRPYRSLGLRRRLHFSHSDPERAPPSGCTSSPTSAACTCLWVTSPRPWPNFVAKVPSTVRRSLSNSTGAVGTFPRGSMRWPVGLHGSRERA